MTNEQLSQLGNRADPSRFSRLHQSLFAQNCRAVTCYSYNSHCSTLYHHHGPYLKITLVVVGGAYPL